MGKNYRTIQENHSYYKIGDIVTLVRDDESDSPYFKNLTRINPSFAIHLDRLEEIAFKVGDRVKLSEGKALRTTKRWLDEIPPASIGEVTIVSGEYLQIKVDEEVHGGLYAEDFELVQMKLVEKSFKVGTRVRSIFYDDGKNLFGTIESHKEDDIWHIAWDDGETHDGSKNNYLEKYLEIIEENLKREGVNTMQEFNEGDKVMLESGKGYCFSGEATARKCKPSHCGHGGDNVYAQIGIDGMRCHCNKNGWKLISAANTMANLVTITKEQKAGLSKENQALLELGLINDKLTPTETGFEYLRQYLFAENRDALAVKAQKEVAEAKAEAKKKETKQG